MYEENTFRKYQYSKGQLPGHYTKQVFFKTTLMQRLNQIPAVVPLFHAVFLYGGPYHWGSGIKKTRTNNGPDLV